MVLGVLGSDGSKMPLYFFLTGEKIGAEAYYEVLRYHVLPMIQATYPDSKCVWMQDGAPAHRAKKVQNFCKENMANFWPKDIWPPSSWDLTPPSIFFWWDAIEKSTSATPHPNVDLLKTSISKVWTDFPEDSIAKACSSFRGWIEAVIAASGGHIE